MDEAAAFRVLLSSCVESKKRSARVLVILGKSNAPKNANLLSRATLKTKYESQ